MRVGPGYCPVWWYTTEYQISYSTSDLILRWGQIQSVYSVSDQVDVVRFFGMNRVSRHAYLYLFHIQSAWASTKSPRHHSYRKKEEKMFLRKPISSGICLVSGKLTKEHRTGFVHKSELGVDQWESLVGGNAFHTMDTGDPALLHDLGTLVASLGCESPALVAILPSTSRRPVSVIVFLS